MMPKKAKGMSNKELQFKTAFKFPFNRPQGLFNILWVFLPIIEWLALFGYNVRIIKGFIKGNFKELPLFNFSENLALGFFMLLKAVPFIIVIIVVNLVIGVVPVAGFLANLFINAFIVPVLALNFFNKETIESYFDLSKVRAVFENIEDYIVAWLKSIGLAIIFIVMFLILVGIPAHTFTKNIFLADFYRRNVK